MTPSGAEPPVSAAPAVPAALLTVVDLGLRLAAAVIATLLGMVLALITAFLVPLRVGSVPVPISFVLALVGNIALIRFARYATNSRLGIIGPALSWLGVMLTLGSRTVEGDLVLSGDARSLGTLFLGAIALAIAGFLAVSPPPRRAPTAPNSATPNPATSNPVASNPATSTPTSTPAETTAGAPRPAVPNPSGAVTRKP